VNARNRSLASFAHIVMNRLHDVKGCGRHGRATTPWWLAFCRKRVQPSAKATDLDGTISDNDIHISGYESIRSDRSTNGRSGWGVCFYIRSEINFLFALI